MTQITHTEILVLAISALDAKIAEVNQLLGNAPSPQMEGMVAKAREPLTGKREALMQLYKIETGEDYV